MDISNTLAAKSNQLNTDDLIAGPLTITVTQVTAGSAEQPVAIHFDGDQGKPWHPCKSMRRVLVAAWGADASQYVGRRVTLFRDPEVIYGGVKVGGIRVSHLSDIDGPLSIALTVTRQKRAPYKVQPLPALATPAPAGPAPDLIAKAYAACADAGLSDAGLMLLIGELSNGEASTLDQLPAARLQRLVKSGVSAETVARCNAEATPAEELPAAWAG